MSKVFERRALSHTPPPRTAMTDRKDRANCSTGRLVAGIFTLVCLSLSLFVGCGPEGGPKPQEKAQMLEPYFFLDNVANGLNQPTSLSFLPDNRVLILEKGGVIKIGMLDFNGPTMTLEQYLVVPNVETSGELGLLDIAIDPDFETTGAIYLYYAAQDPARLRIVRYTHLENAGGLTSRAEPTSAQVLWSDIEGYPTCCHYGGSLTVGPDGKLYLTMGDKFVGPNAQDLSKPAGKVLRMNTDGTTPDGTDGFPPNPFFGTANYDKIWAYGLRNPFRSSWDPGPGSGQGRLLIGEVGGNEAYSWEDLHLVRATSAFAGTNFGWPHCEGLAPHAEFPTCDGIAHEDPIFAYEHVQQTGVETGQDAAIMGGVVYRGNQFPAEPYYGAYFYADYARKFIRYLTFDYDSDGTGATVSGDFAFADTGKRPVALKEGPDGALYFLVFPSTGSGQLRRISYNNPGGNTSPPVIMAEQATPETGLSPLQVELSADVFDADGDSVTYQWFFGDGTPAVAGELAPGQPLAPVVHTYQANGPYDAHLIVSDGDFNTTSEPITVQVGVPPVAVIDSPLDGAIFGANDVIEFSGHATDSDEGNLANLSYEWQVQFGHDSHFHPIMDPMSLGPGGGSFAANEAAHDFLGDTYFRIDLTVTDSDGLKGQTSVSVRPEKVELTVATAPVDLAVLVDQFPSGTPRVLNTAVDWEHDLSATSPQCVGGALYEFDSWSDGGEQTHTVSVSSDTTITATFDEVGSCMLEPPAQGLVFRVRGDEVEVNGSDVVSWTDSAGATDLGVVSGNPQVIPDALGGHTVVAFDGQDDALGASAVGLPGGATDRSVFLVARYSTEGWGGFAWGDDSCNSAFGLVVTEENNDVGKLAVQGWCNDVRTAENGTGAGWLSQSVVMQGGVVRTYLGGQLLVSDTENYDTEGDKVRLGANLNDNQYVGMEVAEILVFDRAVSDAERQQIEEYLALRYFDGPPPTEVPLANDDTASVSVAGSVVVDVLSNDEPGAGFDPATVTAVTSPTSGTAQVNALTGQVTYTHDGSSSTTDSFEYSFADVSGAVSNPATIRVSIQHPCQGTECGSIPQSGLALWLRADQGVSTSGTAVVGWADQSGSGNDLVAISGEPQLMAAGASVRPVIAFDGVDDSLGLSDPQGLPTANGDRAAFMVVRYLSEGYGGFSWGNPACGQAFGLAVSNENRRDIGKLMIQGWCSGFDRRSSIDGTDEGWLSQAATLEAGTVTLFKDGSEILSAAQNYDTGSGGLRIGTELNDQTKVAMDVAEILVYDRSLTASERQEVETYLANKYLSNPTDEPPAANDDVAFVSSPGGTVLVDVLANDSDPEAGLDPTSVLIVVPPQFGSVSVDPSTGVVTYTHGGSAAAADSFGYGVSDVAGNQAVASVQIAIAQPSCSDGQQNGDEEGPDCGGSCPFECPSCDDGVQNGGEQGVDCGGSCPTTCPSCSDGLQNGDEAGVDCGGSCPIACPLCEDLVTYDAFEMDPSTGGATSDGWNIWTDGDLSIAHSFAPGEKVLTVRARGEAAVGVWPNMVVTVDGASVGSVAVDSVGMADYEFHFTAPGGSQTISIEFTNDYYQDPEDRNLIVAELDIACEGPPPGPFCGDDSCNGSETCTTCPTDCGACPSCTDGVRNGSEAGIDCGGSCPLSCPELPSTYWMEAEEGSFSGNPSYTVQADGAASENAFISSTANDLNSPGPSRASFSVDVAAGNYVLWIRVIAPNTDGDSVWVSMDGGPFIRFNDIEHSQDWLWDSVHDSDQGSSAVTFDLSEGTHTVTLANREDDVSIDKLYLTAIGDVPSGLGEDNDPCVPVTCVDQGAECGEVADGCGAQLDCGGCAGSDVCGANNQCESTCTPVTCVDVGAECGEVADGCGAQLDCGGCAASQACGSDNLCQEVCTDCNSIPQSGLSLWLRSDIGLVTSGSSVTSWQDQSGNQNDLTVISGDPRLGSSTLGGMPVVAFDGMDDSLGRNNPVGMPTGGAERSAFMVVRYHSEGWGGFAWGDPSCGEAFGLVVSQENGSDIGKLVVQGWCGSFDQRSSENGTGVGWLTQSATYQGGAVTLFKDGNEILAATEAYDTGASRLRVGTELNDGAEVAMDVAEIVVYDRALSEFERLEVEAYFASKFFSTPLPDEPPVANDDSAFVLGPGESVVIDVLANDTDLENGIDPTSVVVMQPPQFGTAFVDTASGEITYAHDGSSESADSFTYEVLDVAGNPAMATVTVTIDQPCVGAECPSIPQAGLALWLSADIGVTTVGTSVVGWQDQSGHGNDLTVVSGDPQLDPAGPSSMPIIIFDGTDDSLGLNDPVGLPFGSQERSAFIVVRYHSEGWGGFAWGDPSCGEAFGLVVSQENGSDIGKLVVQGWCGSFDRRSSVNGTGIGWLTQSALYDGATVALYRNGSQILSSALTYDTGTERLRLGSDLTGNTRVAMDVAEIIVYGRALSEAERQEVETYLDDRY